MVVEGLEEYVELFFVDEFNGYVLFWEDFYWFLDGGFIWEKIVDNVFGNYMDDMMFMDEVGQFIVVIFFDMGIYQFIDGGQIWLRILIGSINNGLYVFLDGWVWIGSNYCFVYYLLELGVFY